MGQNIALGLEILEGLTAELESQPAGPAGVNVERRPPPAPPRPYPVAIPNLVTLLQMIGPLPAEALVIGYCEDGLHIFLDLRDAQTGALLIAGDQGCGKTRLLKSVLASARLLNTPRQVCYSLITPQPQALQMLAEADHCYRFAPLYSDAAPELITRYVEIAEARHTGRQGGGALLLAIDDLGALLRSLDTESIDLLHWLVQYGPAVKVWPLATLHSSDVSQTPAALLRAFGSRLLGQVLNPTLANDLSAGQEPQANTLLAGAQFCVQTQDAWIRFWVPN
jgi:hypothetical protein